MLPDIDTVIAGGSMSAMATRTSSNFSRLHLIIVMDSFSLCSTTPIAALSVAIVPKSSQNLILIILARSADSLS